jgi:Sec-independent protein translocase protein TatA
MLAILTNWSAGEILVVLVIAVLVFGRRLPEVVGQAAFQVGKLRRSLEQMRRETGIDREIREVQQALRRGVDPGLRPRDVARQVGSKALEAAGLDAETRASVHAADPRRAIQEARRADVPPEDYSERSEASSSSGGPEDSTALSEPERPERSGSATPPETPRGMGA